MIPEEKRLTSEQLKKEEGKQLEKFFPLQTWIEKHVPQRFQKITYVLIIASILSLECGIARWTAKIINYYQDKQMEILQESNKIKEIP